MVRTDLAVQKGIWLIVYDLNQGIAPVVDLASKEKMNMLKRALPKWPQSFMPQIEN